MLEIKNTEVFGLERSVKAIQNSYLKDIDTLLPPSEKNWDVAFSLGKSSPGLGHDGFLKGITVQFDLKYSQYFSPEFQRYSFVNLVMSSR